MAITRVETDNEFGLDYLDALFGDFVRTNGISPAIRFAKIDTFRRRLGITSDITNFIDDLYEAGYPCVLAGGKMIDFVRNLSSAESLNDYDLWCLTDEHRRRLNHWSFRSEFNLKAVMPYKPHVMEYTSQDGTKDIQVIQRIYSTVDEILGMFDFRTCGIAYDGRYVYWLEGALKDTKNKELVMQCILPKAILAHRLQKYIRKGYTVSNVDFGLAAVAFLEAQLGSREGSTDLRQRAFNDRSFSVEDARVLATQGYA